MSRVFGDFGLILISHCEVLFDVSMSGICILFNITIDGRKVRA